MNETSGTSSTGASPNGNVSTMKAVYTVVERTPGKSYWMRIGVGFVNRDGSLNLRLDALPVNGTLQVREWESERFNGAGQGEARGPRRDALSGGPRSHAALSPPVSPDGLL